MEKGRRNLLKKQARIFSIFAAFIAVVCSAFAAAPVNNPRSAGEKTTVQRGASVGALTRNAARVTRARSGLASRGTGTLSRTGASTRTVAPVMHSADVSRAGTVARSAVAGGKTNARAGKTVSASNAGLARSGIARATAVFKDITKIGSGYAECRESYSTCMDQMCANANDTYRRCFCSDRFINFRDTETRLDQAMLMLQQFQDNNLNAVDKTAAEVNAMYSATVGEQEIKKDTSASAKLLDNIDRLLNGESLDSEQSIRWDSVGILDLDFSAGDDDIWGDAENSIFASTAQDMSTMEGGALFNAAQNQCVRVTKNNCENDSVFNMTKSAYNILISQDCNAYEKTLKKKRETLAQAVRTAEKYLREARLEEYRTHNSADVNECLAKVRTTMLSETACGEDYKRCLDPTGAYINASTGEPIYSPRLFELEGKMSLDGKRVDVLQENSKYNTMLDGYRNYVARDLDSCRDNADFVWSEFKRIAVIEIAQAQSALLEEVRESCVDTIAECYDTQSNSLINFADGTNSTNTSVTAGALGRFTARTQCREKVVACAMLWAPSSTGCTFDGRGHITNGSVCGLQALLDYVNVVDSINIAEKCSTAIDKYLVDLCTPDDKTHKYPYNCKTLSAKELEDKITVFAENNCKFENIAEDAIATSKVEDAENTSFAKINASMLSMFATMCQDVGGMWYDADKMPSDTTNLVPSNAFYTSVFARDTNQGTSWGKCYDSSDKLKCESYNSDDEIIASWNQITEQCTFKDTWYQQQCELIGGYYENAMCYMLD
jgi:hypothetical protein